ncbi:BON domain-containing protein [Paraburkholderia sp. MMS20-SJTN17]|uniref:BON domain-containing protein n=1 Tax=Paraburkholderia translucens TaxID=2886945 RepID=A0ABS8K791_9BURK|nr:BON domain-containing protein [Paraburkholderia sp. MMS20-SJTN17]MCC8400612.1 BON domain-containing protein [Paraburkholderia sp. MMS20-SJTN17]
MNVNGASNKTGAILALVIISSGSIHASAQTDVDTEAGATVQRVADSTSRLQNRPDGAVTRDVRSALRRTPNLDASGIRVRARLGVVTLTGWVPERRQIALAGDAASSVRGVRSVSNQLSLRNSR